MKNLHNPSVVLLPGWGFKSAVFKILLNKLNKYAAVRLMNLPMRELNNKNLFAKLDFISGKLSQNIPTNSIIVGWSLGGLLAIYLCYKFPDKYKKLILLASTPNFVRTWDWPGISTEQISKFYRLIEEDQHLFMHKFISMVQYPNIFKETREYLKQYTYLGQREAQCNIENYLALLFNANLTDYFRELTKPILSIFGEDDAIVPVQTASQLQRLNRLTQIKMIPKAGHAFFLTHSELTLRYLQAEFLDGHIHAA